MIRKYLDKDFIRVRDITIKYWRDEVAMDKELESFIYDFLVRYYLHNNDYCFVNEDEEVNAFLLANMKDETNDSIEYFEREINKLSVNNQQGARKYLEYLEYNHSKVFSHMSDNSIYLGLLASEKKGMGSALINKLKEEAKENGVDSIYLWTDETCNFHYYEKKDFVLIEEYEVLLFSKKLKTFVYKLKVFN